MTCSVSVYISGDFQRILRPPLAGLNYLGFQSSSGAHHSVRDFRSTEIERVLEIRSPGLFLPSPDLSVAIFIRVIGHFWQ